MVHRPGFAKLQLAVAALSGLGYESALLQRIPGGVRSVR